MTQDASNDKDALLTFAIDWIGKRTGFPKSAIAPDNKLRDDLNLDSIKVGELVALMSRKLGRSLKGDPAALANATLTQIVETFFREESQSGDQSAASESRRVEYKPTESLGEWVRTFSMTHAPAPIDSKKWHSLPTSGTAVIVAEETLPHAAAIAEAVRQKGFSPLITSASRLTQQDEPRDIAVLILVLTSEDKGFLACTPAEFDDRVEGLATQLFQVFRWALTAREPDTPH